MNLKLTIAIPIAIAVFSFTSLIDSRAYAAPDWIPSTPTSECFDKDVDDPNYSSAECEETLLGEPVYLSWTAPATRTDGTELDPEDLEGFRIYYGTDEDNLIPLVDVETPFVELNDYAEWVIDHTITDLSPGVYYFAVTAYDHDWLESGFSATVRKEVL